MRRAAILEAAANLFEREGFRATSLDDIGTAVGVSGPAIYQYFSSKQEILAILIEQSVTSWQATVEEAVTAHPDPHAALEALVEAAVALQLDTPTLRAVYYQEFRALDEATRRRLARVARVTTTEWVHLLCEVHPALTEEEARAAVVLVDGLLRSESQLHTGIDRERLASTMKAMALGGLLSLGNVTATRRSAPPTSAPRRRAASA
jgi:AcrR family transcriptional regulator